MAIAPDGTVYLIVDDPTVPAARRQRKLYFNVDELTPKAAALVEALTSTARDQLDASSTLMIRSLLTKREILNTLPEPHRTRRFEEATVFGETLDEYDERVVHGWARYRDQDQYRYAEELAASLPPGYYPVSNGIWLGDRTPVPHAMEAREQVSQHLTAEQAGELFHVGPITFRSYASRGQAPKPVKHVGRTPLWDRNEVLKAAANRPGRGARTDLKRETP